MAHRNLRLHHQSLEENLSVCSRETADHRSRLSRMGSVQWVPQKSGLVDGFEAPMEEALAPQLDERKKHLINFPMEDVIYEIQCKKK